jgi:hypothetical protein
MHRSRINAFSSPKDIARQITELAGVWTGSGLEIGAHIAAVPSNGHDSGRAECRDNTKERGVSGMTEVVGSLQYTRLNSVPH